MHYDSKAPKHRSHLELQGSQTSVAVFPNLPSGHVVTHSVSISYQKYYVGVSEQELHSVINPPKQVSQAGSQDLQVLSVVSPHLSTGQGFLHSVPSKKN